MNLVISIIATVFITPRVTLSLLNRPNSHFITTAERIASFNYPAETHEVVTEDGYILTMFRIPFSPGSVFKNNKTRPVFLLMHGLTTSSDCWILNGLENSLAFVLADAGYDVWMGNQRGNVYSRRNVHISPDKSEFWQFDAYEMGTIDIPAIIDFVLKHTGQESLHYVGHSQGTTVFFILLSEKPVYNSKFKTAFMMAPTAYLGNMKPGFWRTVATIFHKLPFLSRLIENHEFLPYMELVSTMRSAGSWLAWLCTEIIFVTSGWDRVHFNYTLLPLIYATHPAGSSTNELIFYLQSIKSNAFQRYDHGLMKNLLIYGQVTPPNFNISNIRAPVRFYSGENDIIATAVDLKKMEKQLPNFVENYVVPVKIWNHVDFIFAIDVKKYVYDRIVMTANYYEKTRKQWIYRN